MKRFHCDCCGQSVFFENTHCVRCGNMLGYLSDLSIMSTLELQENGQWGSMDSYLRDRRYKKCENYSQAEVCNWMVPIEDPESFCISCRLNRTIPDLSITENQTRWLRLESAKRRLVYSLVALDLPLVSKQKDAEKGLAFDFLADPDSDFKESQQVMTGHANGIITINVAEADDVVREKMRLDMNEQYRTVLGHFRHEIGHYYWERLIRPSEKLNDFRRIFGDEQKDYGQSLEKHYKQGPPADWSQHFISVYASAHPWEDWAETWAHYLHINDALETAESFGLVVEKSSELIPNGNGNNKSSDYHNNGFEKLIPRWLSLTFAVNSLNRSMGLKDLYPFVLTQTVIEKLGFVHQIIQQFHRDNE